MVRLVNLLLLTLMLFSCSKEEKISVIQETRQDLEMVVVYKDAYKSLNEGDPYSCC